MSFDYAFAGLSPTDYFSVGINDGLMFEIQSQFIPNGTVVGSGPIDVAQWAGQNVQLFLG
jgi:hypothetical protein